MSREQADAKLRRSRTSQQRKPSSRIGRVSTEYRKILRSEFVGISSKWVAIAQAIAHFQVARSAWRMLPIVMSVLGTPDVS